MKLQSWQFSVAVLLALAGAATPAYSQDAGWYAGIGLGQSKASCTGLSGTGIGCDDTDASLGLYGGYQFNRYLGIELGYADLGEVNASGPGTTASVGAKGFELSGTATLPFSQEFAGYAKLGVFRWDLDASAWGTAGRAFTVSESGTDLTYAMGVKYDFPGSGVGVRAQWQRYNNIGSEITGTSNVDVFSIGIYARF
jgi:OmpA-OmpF porin, OOP family